MIIDAIVKVLMGILNGILGLLPAYTMPGDLNTIGVQTGSWMGFANNYFPVTTLGVALAIVVSVRLFLVLWSAVLFVYALIPFKAT